MIDWREHITADPSILVGKPVVRGTRLSVEHILMLLGEGWTSEEVIRNYPRLTPMALQAVFAYAANAVRLLPPLRQPDPE